MTEEAKADVEEVITAKAENQGLSKEAAKTEGSSAELMASDAENDDDSSPAEADTPVVLTGKRDRKRTKMFEASASSGGRSRRREHKTGKGTPLGQIPNVSFLLNSAKGRDDELILLHRLLFNSVGVATKRKSDIREFKGFAFDSEKDRDKIKQRLAKEPIALIRKVAHLLDLPTTAVGKPGLIDVVTSFLEDPKPDEDRVDLAAKAQRKKDERARKKERKLKVAEKAKTIKRKGKKRKHIDTDSDSGSEREDDEEEKIIPRVVSGAKGKRKVAVQKKTQSRSKRVVDSEEEYDEEDPEDDVDDNDDVEHGDEKDAKPGKEEGNGKVVDEEEDEDEDENSDVEDETTKVVQDVKSEKAGDARVAIADDTKADKPDDDMSDDADDSKGENETKDVKVDDSKAKEKEDPKTKETEGSQDDDKQEDVAEDEPVRKKLKTSAPVGTGAKVAGKKVGPEKDAAKAAKEVRKPSKKGKASAADKKSKPGSKESEEDDEEVEDGMPSKKDLTAAVEKLLAAGNVDKLTVRSVRLSLESQFGCSLQSKMAFLRRTVAEKLQQ